MFRMYICIKCTRLEIWLGLAYAVDLTDRSIKRVLLQPPKGRGRARPKPEHGNYSGAAPPSCTDDHKRAQD